jgi:hypothetical protein
MNKSRAAWRRATGLAVAVTALAATVTACGGGSAEEPDDSIVPASPAASATTTEKANDLSNPVRVTHWAVNAGTVSLIVQNTQRFTITNAAVDIRVLDFKGQSIPLSRGADDGLCCNIYSLPPGKTYALYVTLASPQSSPDVSSIEIRYRNLTFARSVRKSGSIAVTKPVLSGHAGKRRVDMTMKLNGNAGPYVVGQVFLADSKDKFVAVDSAPYWCLGAGNQYRVHSYLAASIPAGVHIKKAVAYPMPDDVAESTQIPDCGEATP